MLQTHSSPRRVAASSPHPRRRYSKNAVTLKYPAVHTLVLAVTVTLSHASCGFHFSERPQFALFRGRYFSAFSRFFILLLDFSLFSGSFFPVSTLATAEPRKSTIEASSFRIWSGWTASTFTSPRRDSYCDRYTECGSSSFSLARCINAAFLQARTGGINIH
jgi:hypothetical protein